MTEKPLIVIPDEVFEDHDKTDAFIERKINQMSCEDRETFLCLSDCRNLEDPQYCGRFYTNAMNYGVRVHIMLRRVTVSVFSFRVTHDHSLTT